MAIYINVLSVAAVIIFIISLFPQIHKLAKNKTARDISLLMAALTAVGNLLMLIRAVSIRDLFFSVNYAFQLALWLVIITLIVKYRRGR